MESLKKMTSWEKLRCKKEHYKINIFTKNAIFMSKKVINR